MSVRMFMRNFLVRHAPFIGYSWPSTDGSQNADVGKHSTADFRFKGAIEYLTILIPDTAKKTILDSLLSLANIITDKTAIGIRFSFCLTLLIC